MRKFHKALVAGGVAAAVLVPAASALAAGYGPGNGRDDATPVCTGDQAMDQLRARDGSGWRHTLSDGTTVEARGAGYQHQSGTMDGTGPQADRALDGTGNRWVAGR